MNIIRYKILVILSLYNNYIIINNLFYIIYKKNEYVLFYVKHVNLFILKD